MENKGWAYTPEIDGISYDDDGSYSITREKGTKTSVLDLSGGALYFFFSGARWYVVYFLIVIFSVQHAFDEHYHKIKYNQQKSPKRN